MADTPKSPARNLTEVVGRVRVSALMGPTNIADFVILELRADGTLTWRDV